MKRRTMGTGRGQGYLNLVPMDSLIHSLNAKGVVTTGQLYAKGKKPVVYPKERRDIISVLRGKGFRKDFGLIPTQQKRGVIREIARKVVDGVDWAVAWEKEHLPKQEEWVKKEFNMAKDLAKKGVKSLKSGINKEVEKKKDLDDVRDELDTNDDGVQDIPIEKLDNLNQSIKYDLENIDLDNSGTPDYVEDGLEIAEPIENEYSTKSSISFPLPSVNPNKEYGREIIKEKVVFEERPTVIPLPTIPVPEPAQKRTIKDVVKKEYGQARQYVTKKIQEKKELTSELAKMSDNQLREMAVRTPSGFFGKNDYEKELLRRIKKRQEISDEVVTAKNSALQTSLKKSQKKTTGGNYFGFLNPIQTLGKKDRGS